MKTLTTLVPSGGALAKARAVAEEGLAALRAPPESGAVVGAPLVERVRGLLESAVKDLTVRQELEPVLLRMVAE